MSTASRAIGTAIVYMASAIVAEIVVEVALILLNGGQFPSGPLPILLLLVSPLAGFVIASRYWAETELVPDRLIRTPLLFIVLLVVVLAVSSFIILRPGSGIGQLPPAVQPQSSPTAVPALPPAPATHDLPAGSAGTSLEGG